MAVPATVVYFTSYEQLKAFLSRHDSILKDHMKPMVAGSVARIWAATLISPIEMVRTKVQSEHFTYSQVWKAVGDTVRTNGITSMWKGLGPTLLRDVPFSAMYWTGYEYMKSHVLSNTGRTKLTFLESFTVGAASGSIAGVLTLPFDVIKTRRQIELGEVLIGKKKEPTSTWRLISKIYSTEGFKALFTGLPPRLLKVAPSCAIMISTYEFFKHFFASKNESEEDSRYRPYPNTSEETQAMEGDTRPLHPSSEEIPIPVFVSSTAAGVPLSTNMPMSQSETTVLEVISR